MIANLEPSMTYFAAPKILRFVSSLEMPFIHDLGNKIDVHCGLNSMNAHSGKLYTGNILQHSSR